MPFVSFFDFDHTTSQQHTYSRNARECFPENADFDSLYNQGREHASNNIKQGICNYMKHDGIDHISAIATYHNNPDFIAGYVSIILDKTLTLLSAEPDFLEISEKAIKIAIKKYQVEGTDTPFLIAHIPETGNQFARTINLLTGKNEQILFIQQTLMDLKKIDETTPINFYDDSYKNYKAALSLNFIKSHLIEARFPAFTIQTSQGPSIDLSLNNDHDAAASLSTVNTPQTCSLRYTRDSFFQEGKHSSPPPRELDVDKDSAPPRELRVSG